MSVLGAHRFDLYDHVGGAAHRIVDRDALAEAVSGISVAVLHALTGIAGQPEPRPTVLSNDEVEPTRLLGQTLLWADHVCVPDRVFSALIDDRSDDAVQDALTEQYALRPLIEAGVVVPVPSHLGVAAGARAVEAVTRRDLARDDLVSWVRSQLIVEGPTAREAMLVTAQDGLAQWSNFWLYSRRSKADPIERTYRSELPGTYDPTHDYGPWRELVLDQATSRYVQHLNERLVTGEVFGAGYLTASPFRAWQLALKGEQPDQPPQAAMWADVPVLPDADAAILARAVGEDEAVADLRMKVRNAMRGARELSDQIDAITGLGEDLAYAGRRLERTVRTERRWQVIAPTILGAGSIALGAAGGDALAVPGALVGLASSLAPFAATRRNRRRDAAYLFFLANRRARSHSLCSGYR